MKKEILIADNIDNIYDEINALIREKKTNVKKVVNDAIISLNWGIGKRLSAEFTGDNKPEYGKKVVAEVSKRLEQEYGSGFDKTSISRMIKFYQEFPDFEKVATLSQQLTWSHFVEILPIQDELKRDFLLQCVCRISGIAVLGDVIREYLLMNLIVLFVFVNMGIILIRMYLRNTM